MKLRRRTLRVRGRALKDHPMLRGFHAKQRDHAPRVPHPKPEKEGK